VDGIAQWPHQPITRMSVTPPEASHRAIRDVIDRFDAELKRITNINVREDRPHTIPALTAWSFVQDLRAALSTGTETQEPQAK
jgi:hypothetical protein